MSGKNTLTAELSKLLKDDNTPQTVINEVLSSMAIVQSEDMGKLIESTERQEKKLDDLVRSVDKLTSEIKVFEDVPDRLSNAENIIYQYPSIVWLLRYKTKNTITVMIIVFIVLSMWFVSGARQPILAALGLPVF